MIFRTKWTTAIPKATIDKCHVGTLDIAVCSVPSAKNGTNLQGMCAMVTMGWIGRYMDEVQCKGNALYQMVLTNKTRKSLPVWTSETN